MKNQKHQKTLEKIFRMIEWALLPFFLFYYFVLRTNTGIIILATLAVAIWMTIWLM